MSVYDPLTKEERSERMSRVKNRDTNPEMKVRRIVHGMGYRYRLHAKELPGKPDMAFRPKKKVIFVNGCFWHQHDCGKYRMPKTRMDFWQPKLNRNKERDRMNYEKLQKQGWDYLVIWECQIGNEPTLKTRVKEFLEGK